MNGSGRAGIFNRGTGPLTPDPQGLIDLGNGRLQSLGGDAVEGAQLPMGMGGFAGRGPG